MSLSLTPLPYFNHLEIFIVIWDYTETKYDLWNPLKLDSSSTFDILQMQKEQQ